MRILFNVSGASYGHLYPLLPLVRALERRGRAVAVAAPEHFSRVVEQAGLESLPLRAPGLVSPSDEYKALQTSRQPFERGRAAVARYLEQAVLETPLLRSAARAWRADVLVRETTAYAGWLAAELLDLPTAVFDFVATPPRLLAAVLGDIFDRARASVGLPPDASLGSLNGFLHLVAAPPGWFPRASIGPTTCLVQPGEAPPSDTPVPSWLEQAGKPFVYVTLGTMWNRTPGVFERVFQALAGLPVSALATVGPDLDPRSFTGLPARIRVERFLPRGVEVAVLSRADAMICHGGYGALMNAMRHGVPIVTVPLASSDTEANAARMKAFGVGIVVTGPAAAVRDGVREVLQNRSYRDAASRVCASIAQLPPLSAAAPLVERLALERRPILNPGAPVASARARP
jgi:UDP:flavonoid glycosyltransferase YjiC (YdhE family)